MSKATATPLPPPRRLFEPARYSQRYLATAYRQLLPGPRLRPVQAAPSGAGPAPTPRPAVAS
jgi:hypothetical protein